MGVVVLGVPADGFRTSLEIYAVAEFEFSYHTSKFLLVDVRHIL